ncbi:hypothetical protein F5Y18DRAFT_346381 [Xylariaceae sp. FL1019]|nr:hypothetical protein F5Y18DRAFT_346381 [Xylariaceae sp. FL1019]
MGLWNAIGQVIRGPQPRRHSYLHDTSQRRSYTRPQTESHRRARSVSRFQRHERPSGPAREHRARERRTRNEGRERIHDRPSSVFQARQDEVQDERARLRAQSPPGSNYQAGESASSARPHEHERVRGRSSSRIHSMSNDQSDEVPLNRDRNRRRSRPRNGIRTRDHERPRSRRHSISEEQAEIIPQQLRDRTRPPLSYLPRDSQGEERQSRSRTQNNPASSHRQHERLHEHGQYQAELRHRSRAHQPAPQHRSSHDHRQRSSGRSQSETGTRSSLRSQIASLYDQTRTHDRPYRRRSRSYVTVVQEAPPRRSSREYGYPVPAPASDIENHRRRSSILSRGTTLVDSPSSSDGESAPAPQSPSTVHTQPYRRPLSSIVPFRHTPSDDPSLQGDYIRLASSEPLYTRQLSSIDPPASTKFNVASTYVAMSPRGYPTRTRPLTITSIATTLDPGRSTANRPFPPEPPREMRTSKEMGYATVHQTVDGYPTLSGTPVPGSQPGHLPDPVTQVGPSVEGYEFGGDYGFGEDYGGDDGNEYAVGDDYGPPAHGATW